MRFLHLSWKISRVYVVASRLCEYSNTVRFEKRAAQTLQHGYKNADILMLHGMIVTLCTVCNNGPINYSQKWVYDKVSSLMLAFARHYWLLRQYNMILLYYQEGATNYRDRQIWMQTSCKNEPIFQRHHVSFYTLQRKKVSMAN